MLPFYTAPLSTSESAAAVGRARARDEAAGGAGELPVEWLETNGLGDYASSTPDMHPTRRYHGLLVVRPETSEKRHVFLSRFEETVRRDDAVFALPAAQRDDGASPAADETLVSFALTPHPRARHEKDGLALTRETQLVHGARTVLCRYSLGLCRSTLGSPKEPGTPEPEGAELLLRPFLPFREADALTFRNDALRPEATLEGRTLRCRPYDGLPELHISLSEEVEFEPDPRWCERIALAAEHARGFPDHEDHFSPGLLRVRVRGPLVVAASIDGALEDPLAAWERETARRAELLAQASKTPRSAAARRLAYAADDFLVEADGRLGIDAGFPWFTEWGRDTFISLPGLTLARGDLAACERVLSESLAFLDQGLLPNIFGRSRSTSQYGSVDASLWYARAVQLYENAGGERERVLDEYLPALLEIAGAYWDGTRLGVRADAGGLIHAGSPELNATWMDAQTPSGPVTPRHGCAVEMNALWFSLLRHVEQMLELRGDPSAKRPWTERRTLAQRTFVERFWLPEEEYLADVWNEDRVDRSVRPNMVLAAALELSPLKKSQRAGVMRVAEEELLTPRGLRTLSPRDPAYRPRFEGGPEERDGAYHQGTVWPWLFGFYVEAALRAGTTLEIRDELREVWDGLVLELDRAGLNHVSEVFDGDEPQRPGGTIAQAWNTAELLRANALLIRGRV